MNSNKTLVSIKDVVRGASAKLAEDGQKVTQKEIIAVLEALDAAVIESLQQVSEDTAVEVKVLPSGASLIAENVPAHTARNPKTGEVVTVDAKYRVRGKIYPGFKTKVNE